MENGEYVDEKSEKSRKTWKKNFDFLFNICGLMIGLGNVWRFPYLCYKNGGGAFLIVYAIFIVFLILPLIVMESAVGQYSGKSAIKSWCLVPILKGIGFTAPVIMFYANLFYPVILAWALRWLVASFTTGLPWIFCNNTWNTPNCLPLSLEVDKLHSGENHSISDPAFDRSLLLDPNVTLVSSVEEFWRWNLLDLSPGLEMSGGIKWDLLACLLVIWILTYFAIWKGIGWTSKIVYVTATTPVAMLLVVLVRGVTLHGAGDGISLYLNPNLTKLTEVEIWTDAASQLMFSLGICGGGITTLSAYNKFHHNFFRDTFILVTINGVASFISGLTIFSVLGFLAQAKNTTMENVAESGPGLIFNAYPTALSLLPLPQFWCATFFLTVILLGFDTQFVYNETFMACLKDIFPRLFRRKWSYEIMLAFVSFITFLLGISMVTRGGVYVLNIFNTYSATGWCLYFVAFCEFVAIAWIHGMDRIQDKVHMMIGRELPRIYFTLCWKFIGPAVALFLMLYSLVKYQPMTYDRSFVYPLWADLFGWATTLSSILWIPGTAIYVVWNAEGDTMVEKFRNSLAPPTETIRKEELSMLNKNSDSSLNKQDLLLADEIKSGYNMNA